MDEVDQIKRKIDIGDLIGSYITLKRAGRNLKANCPFHNEKSPSFVVSPERQIWHCFGCAKGGDIFTFVEEYERVDFSEALKMLADRAGIKLTQTVFKTQKEEKRSKIYEINHLASQFYHYLLTEHSSGKQALAYVIEKRGLSKALIDTYQIGFAPQQTSALSSYLVRKKSYKPDELIEAGVSTLKYGKLHDFFQNRLIFPIMDARGNILAFSGRALTDNAMPKYINTKETPVYIKGDTVFGLFQAKEGMKKEGKVILMEGEFDAISSFKEGITNAVAVKGTALTENQIRLLKRYVQKIVFCFDTDVAGTEAQRRSISLITHEGINASVVIPPSGKDPDELLKENPGLFKKALKEEINIYDYILDTSAAGQNPETIEGKKTIQSRSLPYLVDIDNEIVKEHYLKKLASLLNTSYESIVKEAEKAKKGKQPEKETPVIREDPKKPRQEKLEQHLFTLILQSPNPKEALVIVVEAINSIPLQTESYHKLFTFLREYFASNETLNPADISLIIPKEIVDVFDLCLLTPIPTLPDNDSYNLEVEKLAKEVKNSAIREQMKKISSQIQAAEKKGDEEALQYLQTEFNNLTLHLKS